MSPIPFFIGAVAFILYVVLYSLWATRYEYLSEQGRRWWK